MSKGLDCEQVVERLTDLDEGALPFLQALRMRLHLLHCADCRELRSELRKMPEVIQGISEEELVSILPVAQNALKATLERIGQFHPIRKPQPSPVPTEIDQLLKTGADLSLRIMEAVHRAFVEGTAPLAAPYLPETVLAQLPSRESWSWKTFGSAKVATLMDAGNGGPRLSLLVAPRGFRRPQHIHLGTEQMLVLDGLMEDGDDAYASGRWVHFGEKSVHAPRVLNDECWCLIREEGTVRFLGPLGWIRNLMAA